MSPAERLRFWILAAQRDGHRLLAEALAPIGLTPAQAEVLAIVDECGALSLQGVGDRLVCETGRPSRLVDAIVNAGLLRREDDPSDRRRLTLTLTTEGRRALRRARKVEATLHDYIASVLSPDELAVVTAALQRLTANLPAGRSLMTRTKASGRSP
ncbi:MAG: MarR family winged helix-turn-helix transcriptional regulator [Gemmatimonas sp.]|uniref:MarR family winged helix-turn-helix transcriptional regulator n=1 Tax=Gemmatimonas sp. TaxID=1962908 RepID=UPI00391FBEB4|nr:MarR family winged helix-turn-helix transcriptional regulator [Gemmatimonadota bacterium]